LKPSSDAQSADVTFEKTSAAKTALLLDNTQLNNSLVHVSAGSGVSEGTPATSTTTSSSNEVTQEDKPRARILAEYLAHGYTISDKAIKSAIDLDSQHGYSSRFTQALQMFDERTHASETAAKVDQKYNVSGTAAGAISGLGSYFEAAMGTPTGQRVRQFYQIGNKQVMDVHTEARRLADLKGGNKHTPEKVAGSEKTKCSCGANEGVCGCAPGECACSSCGKNKESSVPSAEEANMETVAGGTRTKCNCGGADGKCPCAPGKCACSSCGKNVSIFD